MVVEEMANSHKQFLRVFDPSVAERFVNIVNDHGADFFPATWLLQEIVSQSEAEIVGICSCSPIVSSSLSPPKAMQSSNEIMISSRTSHFLSQYISFHLELAAANTAASKMCGLIFACAFRPI
jgi:hypothetical protein